MGDIPWMILSLPAMNKHDYLPADNSFLVNDNDPDLRPIRISLPSPPPLEMIDGYGLPPEDQRFRRVEIPPRLVRLGRAVLGILEDKRVKNKKYIITLWKLQKEYWDILSRDRDKYKSEIEFIKKLWWHRLYGYWFFNHGKPTYITGWHFFYLNFWYMPDVKPDSYPHYRDRDRREFLFHKYANETTESFKHLDDNGMAIKQDGKYEMIDTGKRICYGLAQSKNRRSGNTNKGLNIIMEVVTRSLGTDGAGIMSYTGDNAESHFKTKLIPAWERFPMFFMPMCVSPNNPSQLVFGVPSGEYGVSGLQTGVTYASTSSPKFYDGKKLVAAVLDEEGKTESTSISLRWQNIRHCLSQGSGGFIHGYAYHPSTVEDYTRGGADYKVLMSQSSFYQRIKASGQTPSGLFRIFVPGDEALDGFIDSYGMSVRGDAPVDYQKKEGFVQTATRYLLGILNYYLSLGTPEAMSEYRAQKKQFPLYYADSWLGETGDIGFDLEIIDNAITECGRKKETVRGNFEWSSGMFGGSVEWHPDEENGRWEVSRLFEGRANQRVKDMVFDPIEQMEITAWAPLHPDFGTIGADPFKFKTKTEIRASYSSHGMSDGGICAIREFDPSVDDRADPMSKWQSYDVVCTYRYRPATDDIFCEDVLKTCIWYGMMAYPEMNIPIIYKKFREWGYHGYLKHDVSSDGIMKNEPGCYMQTQSKQEGFSMARNFIKKRGHTIKHESLLKECKSIQSSDDLQEHDLLAAFVMALLGTRSAYSRIIQRINEAKIDINGVIRQHSY